MTHDECRLPGCSNPRGESDADNYRSRLFCSPQCDVKHEDLMDDRPTRSEPADFGHGDSTGVQDL